MPVSRGQVTHAPPTQGLWRLGEMVQRHLGGEALGLRERKMRPGMLTWCVCTQRNSGEKSVRTLDQGFSSKLWTNTRVLCVLPRCPGLK